VQVVDELPSGAKFVSASPGYGQNVPFGWIDALPANTTKTYTVTARIEKPVNGGISNTARLQSGSSLAAISDGDSEAFVAVQYVALSAQVPPSMTITPGTTSVFTIEHCNTGNVTATGVKVTIKFPPEISSVTLPAYWVASPDGEGFEGPIGSLPEGTCSVSVFHVVVPADWPTNRPDLGVSLNIEDDGTHGLDPNDVDVPVRADVYLPIVMK
jgi:uncharacterized repeat protein (TIGR01451 family)